MSDAYAIQRFIETTRTFQALEKKLRESLRGDYGKTFDSVFIDLRAAIPGLEGEDLGRALVFKAYVTHWRYLSELHKKSIFDVIGAPVDPRFVEAIDEAKRGLGLLRTDSDIRWAKETVKTLEKYTQAK